jgi:hypothetical protein
MCSHDHKSASNTTQPIADDTSYLIFGAQRHSDAHRGQSHPNVCLLWKLTDQAVESEKRELIEEVERLQQRASRGTRKLNAVF